MQTSRSTGACLCGTELTAVQHADDRDQLHGHQATRRSLQGPPEVEAELRPVRLPQQQAHVVVVVRRHHQQRACKTSEPSVRRRSKGSQRARVPEGQNTAMATCFSRYQLSPLGDSTALRPGKVQPGSAASAKNRRCNT